MLDISKGKYWNRAWSLVEGCTPVSEGCAHCWLDAITNRFTGITFKKSDKVIFREDRLKLPEPPIKRNSKRKYQVWAIWSDLYHPVVIEEQIYKVYDTMRHCQGDIFLILTKRPERMAQLFPKISSMLPDRLNHVWHGVTAENQQRADERIPYLLQVLGKTFLSLEPLLGEIDLRQSICNCPWFEDAEKTRHLMGCSFFQIPEVSPIHQVIVGSESGSHRRPCKIEWIRSIVQQCKEAGIPCFVKSVHMNGKVSRNMTEWPENIRVRQLAWR